MKKKTNCGIIMCGGVISQSTFDKSPWGNMMKMVMPDRWFAKYDKEKDPKKAHRLYMKYARSMIWHHQTNSGTCAWSGDLSKLGMGSEAVNTPSTARKGEIQRLYANGRRPPQEVAKVRVLPSPASPPISFRNESRGGSPDSRLLVRTRLSVNENQPPLPPFASDITS